MIDETLIRDLNRIVNDRNVSQHHRNVARRAVIALSQDGTEDAYDPDKTDFKANFAALEAREAQHLRFMEDK